MKSELRFGFAIPYCYVSIFPNRISVSILFARGCSQHVKGNLRQKGFLSEILEYLLLLIFFVNDAAEDVTSYVATLHQTGTIINRFEFSV